MAVNTQTIRVDLNTGNSMPVAFAHQNDTNRQLTFTLYNNGVSYDLSGFTAKFGLISPRVNGQYFVIAGNSMASGTVSGNTVTVTLPETYNTAHGVGLLTMILTSSGKTIRPINIKYVVQRSADGLDAITGASDFPTTLKGFVDNWFDSNSDEYLDAWLTGALADQDLESVVNNWLDEHPEATTTVQDHSLTYTKLVNGTLGFVTPQMYGAKGDGVADDTDAIKDALAINKQIFFPKGTYNVAFENDTDAKPVLFSLRSDAVLLFEEGAVINVLGSSFASLSAVFGFTEFPTKNVVIDGATIKCESLHSTNPMGIRFETPSDADAERITNVTIENCTFKNLDSAVYIIQRNTSGVSTRQTKNVLISNCKAFSCLSSFVTADGENITIKNCIADGQGNAGAYDAVSVHSGINIKIIDNVFKGYTIGQVINIRNSPENKCGTMDVLISGNSIVDCPTIAIQISVTSGETTYGTTNVSVIGNRVYNCGTGITITPGSATSGTPFKNFVVSGNIFESCSASANFQANTTVWNERMTIANNIFANSGNFAMTAVRACTFVGNYINLKTGGSFTANTFYYSDFSGNIVWADNTEISFDTVVYVGIFSNFFKGVVKLASFSNADFFGNSCMNLLTINGAAGYSVKTDYRHGQIITYSNNRPTGATTAFNKGDMFINSDLSTDVYAWVCTASGSPGTWKAISLA